MTALSRILFGLGVVALAALIITPWAAIPLVAIFALEGLTSPDEAFQRRRAYRKAQRQQWVTDAIRARQQTVSVLDQAEHIINTEAARIAEMPGLDMDGSWPG